MRLLLTFFAASLISINVFAQKPDTMAVKNRKDSVTRALDSVRSKPFKPRVELKNNHKPDTLHSPHKAVIRSLILPGWGQVYNHRIWKVPLIYGGFTGLGLIIQFNLKYYNIYIKEAKARRDNTPRNPDYALIGGDYQQFFDAAAVNQRNFQLAVLGVVGFWGINCIDAYIDAKFRHSYTVDNDLSFNIAPTLITPPLYAANIAGIVPGVKLTFTLK